MIRHPLPVVVSIVLHGNRKTGRHVAIDNIVGDGVDGQHGVGIADFRYPSLGNRRRKKTNVGLARVVFLHSVLPILAAATAGHHQILPVNVQPVFTAQLLRQQQQYQLAIQPRAIIRACT
jgi:hypothetical protein